jgi:hypothetical protein
MIGVLSVSVVLAFTTMAANDSVRLVGDTLRIEPLGVRATVPALWMGRVPPDAAAFGQGRFGCQLNVSGPVSDRVVTDPSKFAEIITGIYGPVRSAQEAIDSILPRSAMVANVGGDRFNGNCVAPKIHVYVADTSPDRLLQARHARDTDSARSRSCTPGCRHGWLVRAAGRE